MARETVTEHVVQEISHEVAICDKCGREADGRQITLSVEHESAIDTSDMEVTQDVCDECLADTLNSGPITEMERIDADDIGRLHKDSVLTIRPTVSNTERRIKKATMHIRQYTAVLTLILLLVAVITTGYSLFLAGGVLLFTSLGFVLILSRTKYIRDEMAGLYEEIDTMRIDKW